MNIKSIINKKANKKTLTKKEINFFVNEYTLGNIPDYQASALLMAIKINGMKTAEIFALTEAMINSGKKIDLQKFGMVVDKHSTGGVSDTTTIPLVAICAACGIKMLKMSGNGLGHTGGTIDKLSAFDGYTPDIDIEKAKDLVQKNGACIITSSKEIVPADKKLYVLRDVTATVESPALIAASVMSKKLAGGAAAIVLDVKYGGGAFIKTKKQARELGELMVKIAKKAKTKIDYIISNMHQPLGFCIGNRLEAYEAIGVLQGKKSMLYDATLNLSAKCIALGKNISYSDALRQAETAIKNKSALNKLKDIISSQNGSLELFNGTKLKPTLVVKATKNGVLKHIDCHTLGMLVGQMGATRFKIDDIIDNNVGLKTFHKVGDDIKKGEKIFEIYAKNMEQAKLFMPKIVNCYKII